MKQIGGGYTHKVKIKLKGGAHYRVAGKIETNSKEKIHMVFDKILD